MPPTCGSSGVMYCKQGMVQKTYLSSAQYSLLPVPICIFVSEWIGDTYRNSTTPKLVFARRWKLIVDMTDKLYAELYASLTDHHHSSCDRSVWHSPSPAANPFPRHSERIGGFDTARLPCLPSKTGFTMTGRVIPDDCEYLPRYCAWIGIYPSWQGNFAMTSWRRPSPSPMTAKKLHPCPSQHNVRWKLTR